MSTSRSRSRVVPKSLRRTRDSPDIGEDIVVGEASRKLAIEPLSQETTPGPATLSRQDTLTLPQGPGHNPLERPSQPERKTVIYRAGPSYRTGSGNDIESARPKQPERFPDIIHLGSVSEGSKVKWDGKKGLMINVDIKILHPDCLLAIEEKDVITTMAIAKGEKYKCFRKTQFVRTVDPKCRFVDFLFEIVTDVGSEPYVNSKTLKETPHDGKYQYVVVARCETSEAAHVVVESNWNAILQDKQKGTGWKFELYLIEVEPAGKPGKWETFSEKKG